VDLALDIFNEMADSLSKDKKNFNELEGFCLVNIIKIKFKILLNQSLNDIKTYEYLINRIDLIIDRLDLDEGTNWITLYNELKEEIEEKREELLKIEKNKLKKYNKIIEELNILYKTKIKIEKKPMEFIDFIISKYPFYNYENIKDSLKDINIHKKHEIIFPKYQPDNYGGREDYVVYNEIYILLGKMKEDLIKYK
jgi:hypothetical protein